MCAHLRMKPAGKDDKSTSKRVPEVGLEPTRPCGHWILNPARAVRKPSGHKKLHEIESTEVPTMVPSHLHSDSPVGSICARDPELERLLAVWDRLPKAIKIGILAMVEAMEIPEV